MKCPICDFKSIFLWERDGIETNRCYNPDCQMLQFQIEMEEI